MTILEFKRKVPVEDVCYIPNAWVEDFTFLGPAAFGLAVSLIAFKGRGQISIVDIPAIGRTRTKKTIVKYLSVLIDKGLVTKEGDNVWLFTAPQPEGEMQLRIVD